MRRLSLADVAQLTGGELGGGAEPGDVVMGAAIDSRAVEPGQLFVALAGTAADGHDFAPAAIERGACAVIAERPVAGPHVVVEDATAALGAIGAAHLQRVREDGRLTVVALTGSVGKTTTKDLLARLLGALGPTIAPPGSLNNQWGVPLTILRADETTSYLVLEMGANHLGEIAYLTSIAPPDLGLVLGVGDAHLGEFGSREAIAQAKSELVTGTRPGGFSVLNADNEPASAMARLASGPVVRFGSRADADLCFGQVTTQASGSVSVDVSFSAPTGLPASDWPPTRIDSGLAGVHNAVNIAAACAVAACLGLSAERAAAALRGVGPASPHRLAITDRADGVRIIDDAYNANPQSMSAALEELAGYRSAGRRTIAIVGEMRELGAERIAAHEAIGRLAAELGIDLFLGIGERLDPAITAARQARKVTEARLIQHNGEAAAEIDSLLRAGDVVLLKGSYGSGLWRLADQLTAGTTQESREENEAC